MALWRKSFSNLGGTDWIPDARVAEGQAQQGLNLQGQSLAQQRDMAMRELALNQQRLRQQGSQFDQTHGLSRESFDAQIARMASPEVAQAMHASGLDMARAQALGAQQAADPVGHRLALEGLRAQVEGQQFGLATDRERAPFVTEGLRMGNVRQQGAIEGEAFDRGQAVARAPFDMDLLGQRVGMGEAALGLANLGLASAPSAQEAQEARGRAAERERFDMGREGARFREEQASAPTRARARQIELEEGTLRVQGGHFAAAQAQEAAAFAAQERARRAAVRGGLDPETRALLDRVEAFGGQYGALQELGQGARGMQADEETRTAAAVSLANEGLASMLGAAGRGGSGFEVGDKEDEAALVGQFTGLSTPEQVSAMEDVLLQNARRLIDEGNTFFAPSDKDVAALKGKIRALANQQRARLQRAGGGLGPRPPLPGYTAPPAPGV